MEDTPSVRQALAELQLKTRLLGEERDYYSTLFVTSQKAFDHHRRELDGLLARERDLFHRREESLQRELQSLLQDGATLRSHLTQERSKATARVGGAMERLQRESLAEERRLRAEAETLRRESAALQEELALARREQEDLGVAVEGERARHTELQQDVADQLAEQQRLLDSVHSAAPRRKPSRASRPAFVAAGAPTSHNARVLVQTALKRNYRTGVAAETADGAPSLLDDVTASLLDELHDLRAEYDAVAQCLPAQAGPASAAVRRLRALFDAIDQKTQQLQAVRKSQSRADTRARLARLLEDTKRKNERCTGAYRALMETLMLTQPQLLQCLGAHLDKHMFLPVLRFALTTLSESDSLYGDLAAAIQAIYAKTSMLGEDPEDPSVEAKKTKLLAKHAELTKKLKDVIPIFFNVGDEGQLSLLKFETELKTMRENDALSTSSLAKDHGVKAADFKLLYDLGFLLFDTGAYDQAADVLCVYQNISGKDDGDRETSALWGRLACDTLMGYWDAVRGDIDKIRKLQLESMETTTNAQRVALLHWSLFLYFKGGSTTLMADHLYTERDRDKNVLFLYANVLRADAPHLLRYVAAAAVLCKKKKKWFTWRAARLAEQETYQYSDPITRFLDCMVNKSDFDGATALLPECEELIRGDYFLADRCDDFLDAARMMIYEDKLRVHQTLSIPHVAEQLGMAVDKTEVWLVDLIREAKLDAMVDSEKLTVEVHGKRVRSVWRQVQEELDQADRIALAIATK